MVGLDGGTTGLSVSNSPVTSSGTMVLDGVVAILHGGTGATTKQASFDALAPTSGLGQLVYHNGTTNTALTAGSVGQQLTVLSGSGNIGWTTPASSVSSVDVSGGSTGLTFSGGPITSAGTLTMGGTLSLANGGTGATTKQAAFNALSPATANGQIVYSNGTNNVALTPGTAGQHLTVLNGSGTIGWTSPTTGTVTSVAVSGGTTGLTTTGGPITSNGTITLDGTLAIANGGSGATTAAGFQAAALPAQASQSGKFLTTNGTVASWADVPGGTVGTVTSVAGSGGTTGLTFSGGPITDSGTLTLGGTLAIANGGSGATTAAGFQAAALPAQASNAGKVLSTNGTAASWVDIATGTVTSVDVSGGATGLSFAGGPITSSGTATLGGILAVTSGGTGANAADSAFDNLAPTTTQGDMIYHTDNGNRALLIGNTGDVLSVVDNEPAWVAPTTIGGAAYVNLSEGPSFSFPPGKDTLVLYSTSVEHTETLIGVVLPANPSEGQVCTLRVGFSISGLYFSAPGKTLVDVPYYMRDNEELVLIHISNVWRSLINPRHVFVVAQGDIGTTGTDLTLDIHNIRFTLKYRTGSSTQATAQTITGSEMIDLRWVSIYNGAIDASAYDSYNLTTTPVVVDSVIYDASNELPLILLRENDRIWRIHFFASANGTRTTFWARRVV